MASASPENGLLTSLLRDVSRSFYLTLRALPVAVRPRIGLAYLLARATDTIADTDLIPVADRLQALDHLRDRILGRTTARLDFHQFIAAVPTAGNTEPTSRSAASPAEKILLCRIEEGLAVLASFSATDQKLVREVLTVITSGQQLDLQRFEQNRPANATLVSLQTDEELDDYTYRVAGCVGEFWTRICRAHLFPHAQVNDEPLLRDGIRFGKGLQLVNILRDLPADLRKGRCYIPATKLLAAKLSPEELLQPAAMPRFAPLYAGYLDLAHAHLAAGWDYTNALPRNQIRVRLACAWPVLIGIKTLGRLRHANVLDAGQRVKINRTDVRGIMLRTILYYPFPSSWQNLFAWAEK